DDDVTELLKRDAIKCFAYDGGSQPGRGRAAASAYISDDEPFFNREVERTNNVSIQRSWRNPEPGARDIAFAYDLRNDSLSQVYRDGEANADGTAAGIWLNRSIDAN